MRISERFYLDDELIFFILLIVCRCSVLIRAVFNGADILMLEYSYHSLVLYIILFFSLINFYLNCFFLLNYLYIYFYVVKDVLINPSNREELQVDKLTMVFNCPNVWVGTTVEPNVPDGISKMFVYHFIFFILLFFIYFVMGFHFIFLFFLLNIFFVYLIFL
jgi:hypothetical protein